jgi:DNA-binding XRE family transcriptional regulator
VRQPLEEIGARLTSVRGQQSQAEFAPTVGIHKNTIGNYERGEREIGALALARFVELGWNANWLLTGQGPERLDEIGQGATAVSAGSQPLKPETLMLALQLAGQVLEHRDLTMPPLRRAEFVTMIYDLLEEGLPEAKVLRFARQAAA